MFYRTYKRNEWVDLSHGTSKETIATNRPSKYELQIIPNSHIRVHFYVAAVVLLPLGLVKNLRSRVPIDNVAHWDSFWLPLGMSSFVSFALLLFHKPLLAVLTLEGANGLLSIGRLRALQFFHCTTPIDFSTFTIIVSGLHPRNMSKSMTSFFLSGSKYFVTRATLERLRFSNRMRVYVVPD